MLRKIEMKQEFQFRANGWGLGLLLAEIITVLMYFTQCFSQLNMVLFSL